MRRQWCIPEVGAQFVWRMEDILYLYEESYDPKKPVVCFDELPYQLVAEKRVPISAKPGRTQRYDYEYERRGTTNLLAFFEPRGRCDVPASRDRVSCGAGVDRVYADKADVVSGDCERVKVW